MQRHVIKNDFSMAVPKSMDEDRLRAYIRLLDSKMPTQEKDHSLTAESIKAYKEKICEQAPDYPAISYILDRMVYISPEEFTLALRETSLSVARFLNTGGISKWSYQLPIKHDETKKLKSNFWVTSMALSMLKNIAPEPEQSLFVDPSFLYKAKGVKTFVFFDDAIYSGTQMGGNVFSLLKRLQESLHLFVDTLTVVVASPYISANAIQKIINKVQSTSSIPLVQLVFAAHHHLFSVNECPDPPGHVGKELTALSTVLIDRRRRKVEYSNPEIVSKEYCDEKNLPPLIGPTLDTWLFKQYPLYFSHKIPDDVSGYPGVLDGVIPPLADAPEECPQRRGMQLHELVKNCISQPDSAHSRKKKWSEPLRDDVQCPFPPYQSLSVDEKSECNSKREVSR